MSHHIWVRIGFVVGLLLLATTAAAEDPQEARPAFDPFLAELGSEHYAQYCSSCHGPGGRGDGPVARVLRAPPADQTRIADRRGGEFPTGEIARYIDGRFEVAAHGSREMPVWGESFTASIPEPGIGDQIARGVIATLVEYLKSIQRTGADGAVPTAR